MRDSIMDDLKKQFRPEFLNRVDAVVVFQRLNHEQMKTIVDLMLAKVAVHLAAQELVFTVSDEAKDKMFANSSRQEVVQTATIVFRNPNHRDKQLP